MVEYAVSDLVKEVKVLLDRNQESAGLLAPSDSDTLSQAELIESKIVDAARIILSDAPEDMVEGRLVCFNNFYYCRLRCRLLRPLWLVCLIISTVVDALPKRGIRLG